MEKFVYKDNKFIYRKKYTLKKTIGNSCYISKSVCVSLYREMCVNYKSKCEYFWNGIIFCQAIPKLWMSFYPQIKK